MAKLRFAPRAQADLRAIADYSFAAYGRAAALALLDEEVTLYGPKRTLTFAALVDSGADHCLFHADVGEALGIDRASCQTRGVQGIDGEVHPCFIADVALEVKHLPKLTVPVMFWEKQPISLIGQTGFFDLHRVKFERDHDVFEITPASKAP